MKEAENSEQFFYGPVQSNKGTTNDDDGDDEHFSDANDTPKQVAPSQIKQTNVVLPPSVPPTVNKV